MMLPNNVPVTTSLNSCTDYYSTCSVQRDFTLYMLNKSWHAADMYLYVCNTNDWNVQLCSSPPVGAYLTFRPYVYHTV